MSARCWPDVVSIIKPLRDRPDVGTMSARYRFRHLADIEPLWFTDIGPTSSLYRPDVGLISLTTSGRHRAHVQTWSRPDMRLCRPDVGQMSAWYHFRHLADIGPLVFRHRPDIESISARCRSDIVDDIWPTSSPRANMESARYQPTFADIGPI